MKLEVSMKTQFIFSSQYISSEKRCTPKINLKKIMDFVNTVQIWQSFVKATVNTLLAHTQHGIINDQATLLEITL